MVARSRGSTRRNPETSDKLPPVTDSDIKQAMKALATVTGLKLTDERIDSDLPAYKSYLAAMETIQRVDLSIETEPIPIVVLPAERRR